MKGWGAGTPGAPSCFLASLALPPAEPRQATPLSVCNEGAPTPAFTGGSRPGGGGGGGGGGGWDCYGASGTAPQGLSLGELLGRKEGERETEARKKDNIEETRKVKPRETQGVRDRRGERKGEEERT